MSDYHVTVADRFRTMTNEELAETIVDYVCSVIANTVDKFGIEFTPNKPKYIEVLRKQLAEITTEQPRMYTIEELKAMRGDKIYICHINACAGFCKDIYAPHYKDIYAPYYGNKQRYVEESSLGLNCVYLPLSHYGTSWIAFAYKPQNHVDRQNHQP